MIIHEMGDMKKAMFPMMLWSGKSNGGIAQSPQHEIGTEVAVVFVNSNPKMDGAPSKVDSAGGKVVMPKTPIGENASMATVIDIERNSVGIHSIE